MAYGEDVYQMNREILWSLALAFFWFLVGYFIKGVMIIKGMDQANESADYKETRKIDIILEVSGMQLVLDEYEVSVDATHEEINEEIEAYVKNHLAVSYEDSEF